MIIQSQCISRVVTSNVSIVILRSLNIMNELSVNLEHKTVTGWNKCGISSQDTEMPYSTFSAVRDFDICATRSTAAYLVSLLWCCNGTSNFCCSTTIHHSVILHQVAYHTKSIMNTALCFLNYLYTIKNHSLKIQLNHNLWVGKLHANLIKWNRWAIKFTAVHQPLHFTPIRILGNNRSSLCVLYPFLQKTAPTTTP